MIEFLLLSILGVCLGFFTGLMPGIHPNTVVFLSLPVYLDGRISLTAYIALVTSMAVSHSFHDFLPSIIMGVPEAESAMASVPGADMALEGDGLEAFYATLEGGMLSVVFLIILIPFFLIFLEKFYSLIEGFMSFLLLFLLFFLLFYAESKIDSFLVLMFSSSLGFAVFSSPVNQNFVLLPVFSGLFAVPAIITGVKNDFELQRQKDTSFNLSGLMPGYMGTLGGVFAGILPGMGAATATAFLSPKLEEEKEFLASMGAINTSDAIVSFLSLLLIGKARSGSAVALNQILKPSEINIGFALGISLFSVSISSVLAYRMAPYVFKVARSFEFSKLLLLSLLLILVFTWVFTGPLGLLVLFTSSAVGFAAAIKDLRRCCMAILIVPALQFHATDLLI